MAEGKNLSRLGLSIPAYVYLFLKGHPQKEIQSNYKFFSVTDAYFLL